VEAQFLQTELADLSPESGDTLEEGLQMVCLVVESSAEIASSLERAAALVDQVGVVRPPADRRFELLERTAFWFFS
jgi:hypothetical protein